MKRLFLSSLLALGLPAAVIAETPSPSAKAEHTFSIGEEAFLLDGKPFVIRTGEIHFARVPHEYWRHRLKLMKAMGMNAVCAYLFWNFHEYEEGTYDWTGRADAAEFCRIAQEEGLWVILRPGPYVCAEWDGGGLPWWLLKNENIELRSSDPAFMKPAAAWLKEVGRVLAPLQVTQGGPILMVQVENEYGSYGDDSEYIGQLRDILIEAGFDTPLFGCNPVYDLGRGNHPEVFNVVNFGRDAKGAFAKLREMQPKGPLMCGEFYPGWFDTWGAPHHLGDIDANLADLRYMLKNNGSFSLYMAHGGTTFGMWPGTDRPFKPDTNSYDYDAPISEAGWIGDKFEKTRVLMKEFLLEGEYLTDPPPANPVMTIPEFELKKLAPFFDNLPEPIADETPRHMEAYDQGQGTILYRTTIPAGPAAALKVQQANDFAWIFLDGKLVDTYDRRARRYSVNLPGRSEPTQLDILVHTMGHVNFGREIHDRKGIMGDVTLGSDVIRGNWEVFSFPYSEKQLSGLNWQETSGTPSRGPAFWGGSFEVDEPADTFLDLQTWNKGIVWVNGKCLARFWNIGPTQTAYIPAPWLKKGTNEIIVLDLVGPASATLAGLGKPILDQLRPELDFVGESTQKTTLKLEGHEPVLEGSFKPGGDVQDVTFPEPITGRQFCLKALNALDGKKHAAIAELDLLDPDGKSISHQDWSIIYVSSEERLGEDGSASNAIDGQSANFWHTEWKNRSPEYPHYLVIDLGKAEKIGAFRYTPRAGDDMPGRIKDYQIFIGEDLAVSKED